MYGESLAASLQKRMLKEFHIGPPGTFRMNSFICSYVCWLNIDKNIERLVKAFRGCAMTAKSLVKFHPWPKTDTLQLRLHIDFAGLINGVYYLIVVSSFSKSPEI